MRRLGMLGACVLALSACGGGGGASRPAASVVPAAQPGGSSATRTCKASEVSAQEIYIAHPDHIDVYPTTAQNGDCPARTITAISPPNVWGIAIGNNTIYALEKSAPNSAFSPVLMIDAAASGPAAPSGSTIVRNDGSGGIVYVDAVPAVFETGHDPSRPVIESFPPSPALQNGSPQQNRFFTGGGGPLAVGSDGTVFAGIGAGVNVYSPTAADSGPFGAPGFTPAAPEFTLGDTSATNVAQGIALGPDGSLYVASAPAANPSFSTVAVYAPGATGGAAPSRTIAIPGQVASVTVDAAGELFVFHGTWLDVFAPGGTAPSRSIIVTPANAGPSSLAIGP